MLVHQLYVSNVLLKKNLIWCESKFLKWNFKMRKDFFKLTNEHKPTIIWRKSFLGFANFVKLDHLSLNKKLPSYKAKWKTFCHKCQCHGVHSFGYLFMTYNKYVLNFLFSFSSLLINLQLSYNSLPVNW